MDRNNQNSGVESEINGTANGEVECNTNVQSRNLFDLSDVPNTETSIDLNQMRVDSIPDLSRFNDLQANRLTKLEGLENLKELEQLHINDQGIEYLNGIENQVKLQVLDAAGNSISCLDNLEHLQELEDIWLNNNKISSWLEVDKLSKLKSLQTVYLEHNPIYNEGCANYRRKAILALPQIQQLDATICR
uniref:Protein phosphatase 1 regulatory subunit 22 n=1 Tax=Meloidogyne hapla TaxID=6305 RepID=A0A1I8BAA4_MELHA